MGGFAIRNLITLARTEGEGLAINVHDFQFAFETEQHMSFGTPVISRKAGRVIHHANANLAEILRPPQRRAGVPGMLGGRHLTPIRDGEREPGHLHESSIARSSGRRGIRVQRGKLVGSVLIFFFHHGVTEKNLNRQEPQEKGFAMQLRYSVSPCLRGRKANWDNTSWQVRLPHLPVSFILTVCLK